MADCSHLDTIADVAPSDDGCHQCLASGGRWVHLRVCQQCGEVGCCDNSPGRHATAHFHATEHPIIRSLSDYGRLVRTSFLQPLETSA